MVAGRIPVDQLRGIADAVSPSHVPGILHFETPHLLHPFMSPHHRRLVLACIAVVALLAVACVPDALKPGRPATGVQIIESKIKTIPLDEKVGEATATELAEILLLL